MTSLDYFCLLFLILCSVHGIWRGWAVQAFYFLMSIALYALAVKINTGSYTVFFIPEADTSFKDIMHLEMASVAIVIMLFLLRRFHGLLFVTHPSLPGHQVLGAFLGFLTGFLGLLYLFIWVNFTDVKMQAWWISSFEYQFSKAVLDLITQVF
jgi:hypothetical protein